VEARFLTPAGIVVETRFLSDELRSAAEGLPVKFLFEESEIGDWNAFAEKLERFPVRVLFLETTHLKDVPGLVRRIRSLPSSPAVFALHTEADSAAILQALRGGVSEYLVPPFRNALAQALDRISAERTVQAGPERAGGKVLGFLSAKGGCGATTIACHLARELPKLTGSKTLLADFDLDVGLVSFLFKMKSSYSVIDAAANLHRLDSSYWKAVVSNGIPGLEMLASPGSANSQPLTSEVIEELFRFFRSEYDWVLADLGRGLNSFRLSVLTNCEEVYLITTPEIMALHFTQRTITRLLESGYNLDRLRIILNRCPKQFDVTIQELEKMLGARIFAIVANDYNTLHECSADGVLAPPASAVGRGISGLARRIAGLELEKSKKWFSFSK
jgi:pilus assembly protein CpaE